MSKYIDLDNLLLFGKCKTEFNADKNEWNNVQFTVPMDKIKTLSVLNIITCSECKYYKHLADKSYGRIYELFLLTKKI